MLAARSSIELQEVKKGLAQKFDIKDMDKLPHFLGMKIIQDEATRKIWIGQPTYTDSVLQFGMEKANPRQE